MRRARLVLLAIAAVLVQPGVVAGRAMEESGPTREYVVLYATGAPLSAARAAVAAAAGAVIKENLDVGVATVRSSSPTFIRDAVRQAALSGVARNMSIGTAPTTPPSGDAIDRINAAARSAAPGAPTKPSKPTIPGVEPLAGLQWDMAMIHATSTGSYSKQPGRRGVLVGVIDTGIDGTHPDIAPNFDDALSRNFVTDIPAIDGPCEHAGCVDPANEDDSGHGTHVAGTIAAANNGLGIAGVAPDVTLVNLRAGQDSGFFFLQATVDALTYAGDHGIDVVNMSFFIDPWLFNCVDDPADTSEARLEQRTIIQATNRALDYAHARGVTLIAAEGNDHTDLGHPTLDTISPDYPAGTSYPRTVSDACLSMPAEGDNVIAVSAVGPSTAKADYSNYGLQQTTVAAPGGSFRDGFGTPSYRTNENLILSTYPENVGLAAGTIDGPGGPSLTPSVIRDCQGGTCAYYQWQQGTSMAAPHAVGVAALIISQYGRQAKGEAKGQLTMKPADVERVLRSSATDHACPDPALIDYTIVGRSADFNALCEGTPQFNSIWGDGIVDALAAVSVADHR